MHFCLLGEGHLPGSIGQNKAQTSTSCRRERQWTSSTSDDTPTFHCVCFLEAGRRLLTPVVLHEPNKPNRVISLTPAQSSCSIGSPQVIRGGRKIEHRLLTSRTAVQPPSDAVLVHPCGWVTSVGVAGRRLSGRVISANVDKAVVLGDSGATGPDTTGPVQIRQVQKRKRTQQSQVKARRKQRAQRRISFARASKMFEKASQEQKHGSETKTQRGSAEQ
ncbi:hypothetical protein BDV93DRAFT_593627 [Ceratobasidium sp. AG-I]|nr:hypothetical protein BDV93DRAFT_593627 [Ceratobasidium sp. AG-I]